MPDREGEYLTPHEQQLIKDLAHQSLVAQLKGALSQPLPPKGKRKLQIVLDIDDWLPEAGNASRNP